MNKRLEEIQFARAFAMFAVLFVHFSSTGLVAMPVTSEMFYVYSTFNTIGKLGVPVFFFLSGLVLFYSYNKRPFTKETMISFYKKRMKFIIIPYVMISIFYFAGKVVVYNNYSSVYEMVQAFVSQLMVGKVYTHLYFLFVLIQFYLIFPFILYVFKEVRVRVIPVLIISLIIQFTWFYVNKNFIQVEARGSIFLSYFSFFLFGAAVGVNYLQLDKWWDENKKKFAVITVSLFAIALVPLLLVDMSIRAGTIAEWLPSSPYRSYIFDWLWVFFGLTGGIMTLWLGKMVIRLNYSHLSSFLNQLANLSFGIYLIHPFFLIFFRAGLPGTTPLLFHGWQLFTAIAITAICWVITSVLSKNKYGWIIIGK
ncbi:MAG: acyltransferase [Solibacillus sp.]